MKRRKPRVDIEALYAALEAQRAMMGVSLRTAAKQMGVSTSALQRLQDRRNTPDLESFARMVQWLDIPSENFFFTVRTKKGPPRDELIRMIVKGLSGLRPSLRVRVLSRPDDEP